MTTTFVNGYNVTGNHAKVGREYHVCNAAGNVLQRANGIEPAMAVAAARLPGDVPEPKPQPVIVERTVTVRPPKTAAKPKTVKKKPERPDWLYGQKRCAGGTRRAISSSATSAKKEHIKE